ncbi:DUF4347 domain-containing protein [Halomonas sabkhae]|uniref:DUF4347 domain-containing protein n=1 Tax=Halomonas sabkhae TaxID=626223 RepID=UPI0025B47301|nr:DUF4347 domain-containing protein [Halomonas sabkhae]MDN3524519.1 DUF4347 domain-containing protein [Halomonas sabkhae]
MSRRDHHTVTAEPVDTCRANLPAYQEILFIDSRVPDTQRLIDGTTPGIEVVLLDAERSGVQQVTEALDGRHGVKAIHLVSHGSPGRIELGGGSLDATTLEDRAEALGRWGEALAPKGDIRVYGCEVAAGAPGEAFITTLAEATGAGVAASSTPTGAAARGGDWQLDRHSGEVASEPFLSLAQQREWAGLLASDEFDWDSGTATDNGLTVSETVAGVTLTLSASNNTDMGLETIGGSSNLDGQAAHSDTNYSNPGTVYTFEFDQPIDMSSIELLTTTSSTTATFSADGHADIANVSIAHAPDNAGVVDLSSFTNITSFTMTPDEAEQFYFDEIAFATANAPPSTPVDNEGDSGGTIAENAANGTAVGITAESTDPDGDSVSYTLTDDADGRFQIDADTGIVTVADGSRLDYETATSHSITVQASDEAGADSETKEFVVDVTDANDAPTAADSTLTTDEDTARVFTSADFSFSDEDDGDTLDAVRIDTLPTAGTLALDGNAVTDGQSISASDIANDLLTFTPAADANGDDYASFTFSVSDGSVFSSSHTMTLDVTAVNDAPTLSTDTRTLDTINEDATGNDGTTVSTILGSAGTTDDAEGDTLGVAVTSVTDTDGTWEYSTDGGKNWSTVTDANPADDSALLLVEDDHVRFVPDGDFNGTPGGGITLRAWDQTAGVAGSTGADTTTNGGTSAFATGTANVSVTVDAVNDAPSLTLDGNQTVGSAAGAQTVMDFVSARDPGAANESSQTVSIDSVTTDDNSLFDAQPDIDDASGALTFTPTANANGTATVTVSFSDNGGTTNGGSDRNSRTFDITVNDTEAPTVDVGASSPTNGDTNVPTANNLTVEFSENIAFGASGTITLFSETGGEAEETFDVVTDQGTADGQVDITGSTLTINPTNALPGPTDFSIDIDAGAIEDTPGNAIAAFDGTGTLQFTSIDPDTLITTGAGFDTRDGTNILDGNTASVADNVLRIAAPGHLDAAAVLDGRGGANTVVLGATGAYDFAALTEDMDGFDTVQTAGNGATTVTMDETSELDGFLNYTGQSSGSETLEISGASVDLTQKSFTDWDKVAATTAGATIKVNAETLDNVQSFTATDGAGDVLQLTEGAITLDTGSRTMTGIDEIELASDEAHAITLDDPVATASDNDIKVSASTALTAGVTIDASRLTSSNSVTIDGDNLQGANTLKGGAGHDTIDGGANAGSGHAGDDNTIDGGGGADTLKGGNGEDRFIIEAGDFQPGESIDGIDADGSDRIEISGPSPVNVDFSSGSVSDIEELHFASDYAHDITLAEITDTDGASTSIFRVTADNNLSSGITLNASALTNTDGNADTIHFAGAGTTGDHTIIGGYNADSISGGSGDDTVSGSAGADTLGGGAGADTFQDTIDNMASDTITDFGSDDEIVITNLGGSQSDGAFALYEDTTETLFLDTHDPGNDSFTTDDTRLTLEHLPPVTGFQIATTGTTATMTLNQLPVLFNLDGDTQRFTEGDSSVALDVGGNASVTDPDSDDFDGGELVVSITDGGITAEDVLSVDDDGNGAGLIGFDGSAVTFGGTKIGTATGGSYGNDLVISLNAEAKPGVGNSMNALIAALTYNNDGGDDPTGGDRTIDISLSDSELDSTTATETVTLEVDPVNDAPEFRYPSPNLYVQQGDGVVSLERTLKASDPEDDTLTWSIVSGPDQGSLGGFSSSTIEDLTYTPDADYSGDDAFTIAVGDESATDTVTVDVKEGITLTADNIPTDAGDGADNVSGGPEADLIFASQDNDGNGTADDPQFERGDVLDGGDGTDRLRVIDIDPGTHDLPDLSTATAASNIEILDLTTLDEDVGQSITVDADDYSNDLEEVWITDGDDTADSLTVNNLNGGACIKVKSELQALELGQLNSGDELTIELAGGVSVADIEDATPGGLATLTITSQGSPENTVTGFTGLQYGTTLAIDGTAALKLNDLNGLDDITVDGARASGPLDIDGSAIADTDGDGTQISGGAGADILTGSSSGTNELVGKGGNDTLVGQSEDDILTGGAGDDEFRGTLDSLAGDTVTDFAGDDVVHVTNWQATSSGHIDYDAEAGTLTLDSNTDGTIEAGDPVIDLPHYDGVGFHLSDAGDGTRIKANTLPEINSDGGGDSATSSVEENQTAVTTVAASDPDAGDTATFSISGGDDASLFGIDAATGELTFADAPDFEAPADDDGDGVYDVQVTVTDDDGATDAQDIAVNVTDVNEAPTITSDGGGDTATKRVAENQTAVTTVAASDPDAGDTATFSISGGADASLFGIDADTGELTFADAPNFEAPTDDNGDGAYDVQVTATDDDGATDAEDIAVTVTDVNEAPTAADSTLTTDEDTARIFAAADFAFSDEDDGDTLDAVRIDTLPTAGTLALDGNAVTDGQSISASDIANGLLTFTPAADANGDDYASFTFSVSDGSVFSSRHTMTLDVTAVNDAPTITSGSSATADENQTTVTTVAASDPDAGDTATFSISGGDDASLFGIDAATGKLTFADSPDFEALADDNGDGVYDVQVTATDDDGATDAQNIAVTVTDVNEAPVIATNTGFSVRANRTVILTSEHLDEGDPDDDGNELTYTLDSLPTSGALSLNGRKLQADDTFTQQDIDDGLLSFQSGSTAGQSRFDITLADGGEDEVGTASDTVNIDVTPSSPDPDPDPEPEADLVDNIRNTRPDNLSDQVSRAMQWLDALPDDAQLDVRTLTPTADSVPTEPLAFLGNAETQDAYVIDTQGLPGGSRLRLENIDFASIKGEIEIIGGTGDNVVVADASAQSIVLGEGDDLLYGGGGDDTVGSLGGDDRLFGEAGNDELFGGAGDDLLHGGTGRDLASYDGSREDYVITQEHGTISVSPKESGNDTDTLVNVETLSFANGEEMTIEYSDDLDWITGLYAQVLGRQADLSGLQYWAQQHADGLGRAQMAEYFLTSEEAGHHLPQGEEALDLLYTELLGREADTEGRAYWVEKLASGTQVQDVMAGFMSSEEMRGHDLGATQWDFIA